MYHVPDRHIAPIRLDRGAAAGMPCERAVPADLPVRGHVAQGAGERGAGAVQVALRRRAPVPRRAGAPGTFAHVLPDDVRLQHGGRRRAGGGRRL